MSVKLTFRKDFECSGGAGRNRADLAPYTVDGEPIANVISCSVESGIEQLPKMTLVVYVRETFAENAAVRLKKS